MEVTIQSIRFDADQRLTELVHKQLEKVLRFDNGILDAQVFLKLDADRGGFHEKVVEIKLNRPGKTFIAKAERSTFEEALDEAMDGLLTQVKKLRDKQKE